MQNFKLVEFMSTRQVRDYVLESGDVFREYCHGLSKIIKLTKDLHVYKKAYITGMAGYRHVIVNLIVPVGALVYIPSKHGSELVHSRKMRASEAIVHSSFEKHSATWAFSESGIMVEQNYHRPLDATCSSWDGSFKYRTGSYTVPEHPFYMGYGQCESGIHFYINLSDALTH